MDFHMDNPVLLCNFNLHFYGSLMISGVAPFASEKSHLRGQSDAEWHFLYEVYTFRKMKNLLCFQKICTQPVNHLRWFIMPNDVMVLLMLVLSYTYIRAGVGKLRPMGCMRPARVYYAARRHVGEIQISC